MPAQGPRLHHPHRRRGDPRGRSRGRRPLPDLGLGRDPDPQGGGPGARRALHRALAAPARDPRLRQRQDQADRRSTTTSVYEEMKELPDRASSPTRSPSSSTTAARCPSSTTSASSRTSTTNLGKKVWLKSGGYLIIDQSEALTAIDVNTGRYVGKREPRGDGPQDEPRGRQGGRQPAPLPEHRRADHHRPDRHGERGEPREGLPRAPRRAARRQGQDEHPQDLRARARRDDAQAHPREPGADSSASPAATARGAATCSRRRASPTRCCARSARTCRASAAARSPSR